MPSRLPIVVVALAAAAGLIVVPVVRLGQISFEQGGASMLRVAGQPGLFAAVEHSLLLAVTVPLIAVPLGTGMALLLRHSDIPLRRTLRVVVLLPLVIPQFVLGYSWSQAYGPAGFTDSLFGFRWAGLNGPAGIIVVLVVDAAPLAYLLTTAGLATRARPDLEQAARISGAGPWTMLRTITLPLLRPVLAAELVLTFVGALESFAVPQVLGTPAGFTTLTTRIYADLSMASSPDAFVDSVTLALGLAVVAAVILLPADVVLAPRLRVAHTAESSAADPISAGRRWRAGAVAGACLYGLLAVGLPSLALLSAAVTRAIGLPPTPGNWTLDNFAEALSRPTLLALGHSVTLAAAAACILVGLGCVVVALERGRAGRALGTLALLSFAVPGSTLAVGLLIVYGRWFGGTLSIILLAYLAKFWALAHRSISGAVERIPAAELQAARTSGAGPIAATTTIWLPSMAPALAGAWLLVFITALHEVTMSSLLYSFGSETLAVAVLNREELGDIGTTAALSVVLTALVLVAGVPAWFIVRVGRLRRLGRQLLVPAHVD